MSLYSITAPVTNMPILDASVRERPVGRRRFEARMAEKKAVVEALQRMDGKLDELLSLAHKQTTPRGRSPVLAGQGMGKRW